MAWSYFVTRLNGDGTETLLATELPLSDVRITDDLSGPGAFSASISPAVARLMDDNGDPLFQPWRTAVYAEDGGIRGGFLVVNTPEEGAQLTLDCVGFTGYPKDRPFTTVMNQAQGINADPADLFRFIWWHIQSTPGHNLGIAVDNTNTPLRIGTKPSTVEFTTGGGEDVSFEAGPYVLAYYVTTDLGKELDDLASEGFEYHMEHTLSGETVTHFLRIGYPTLGRRRNDLRFIVGENIYTVPTIEHDGEGYATDVQVLGAGEGRKMVRAIAHAPNTGGLRRMVTVEDKSCTSIAKARVVAEKELKLRAGKPDMNSVVITDHPNAPIGSYGVGDEICIGMDGNWSNRQELWVRVVSLTIEPGSGIVTATVKRVEGI